MVKFEIDAIRYLKLPSMPKKEWNGTDEFDRGVAILELMSGEEACAVCAFEPDRGDTAPVVTKVFDLEPYKRISRIFVVPNYMTMEEDIHDMDLDEESKKKAQMLVKEAQELENEGIEKVEMPKNEYFFDNITNDDEAKAFIQNYNTRNKIKGRIPTTHEGLVMRLSVIFNDDKKKTRSKKKNG